MSNLYREMERRGFDLAVILPLSLTFILALWAGAALLGWIP